MVIRYKVWTDSESAVDLMPHQEQYFNDLDTACDAASSYAHEYNGEPFKAIFHVEDLELEETIDTYENI